MTDSEMFPIAIRDLIAGVRVPVDLHIRLGDHKYVVVVKADSYAQIDRFTHFEDKKIEHFYVRKSEYDRYIAQNVSVAVRVAKQTELSPTAKASLLSQAASSVLKEVEDLGMSTQTYEHAKNVADATLEIVEQDFSLSHMLTSLSKDARLLFDHSMAVSLLAVMIARGHGWVKRLTLEKVALGGLLHDIGKRELPRELLHKSANHFTREENALYLQHPYKGLEILHSITIVPDDVAAIVLEHHENALGQGFPRGLKDVRLNPLSRVVAVANCFIDLTMPGSGVGARTPLQALEYIEIHLGQPFNKDSFRALKSIITKDVKSASKAA